MPRTAVPPNGVDLTGRQAASGEVVAEWNSGDGSPLRLVHTQTSTARTGSVRVDACGHDRKWRPLWAFRYNGPQLGNPREITADVYTAETVLIGAAPQWAAHWTHR